jgi:NAD+ kinase
VRLARISATPFSARLVRKFELPIHGWRGPAPLGSNGGGAVEELPAQPWSGRKIGSIHASAEATGAEAKAEIGKDSDQ